MNELIKADTELFYAINGANNTFFDWFFAIISAHTFIGIVVFLLVLRLSITKYKKHFWVLLALVGLSFLLADRISVMCFKDVFLRLRPSHGLEDVHLVRLSDFALLYGNKGGLYGFVSSHATNVFSLATLFAKLNGKNKVLYLLLGLWGLLTMYSRIYCGYHYPLDVICGAVLGIIIGLIIYHTYDRTLIQRYMRN